MPVSFKSRIPELVFLGIIIAIIGATLYETRVVLVAKRAASGDAFSNSAFFPELIAGLMALCALTIAIQSYLRPPDPQTELDADEQKDFPLQKLGLFLGIVIFYIATFRWFGYYLSTTLTVAAMLALLGARSILAYAVFPVSVALIIGFAFEVLFNVVLPLGLFGLTLQSVFR